MLKNKFLIYFNRDKISPQISFEESHATEHINNENITERDGYGLIISFFNDHKRRS